MASGGAGRIIRSSWWYDPRRVREEIIANSDIAPPVLYAGFWIRAAAALVDFFILFIPCSFIAFAFVVAFKMIAAANHHDVAGVTLVVWPVVTLIAVCLYFGGMEGSAWQATLGKMMFGLRVSDTETRRAGFGRAMGRNAAKGLSMLSCGVGFIICGFTKRKQALHDIVAGCLVLRRSR